jgi:hypothetical protein
MTLAPLPRVTLTPVALFPEHYFLENLAVRADGSVLITAVLQKELWYVPAPVDGGQVRPILLASFDHLVSGIAEVAPDVFILSLCDAYTTHESHLVRFDLNDWTPGDRVETEIIFTFTDDRVRGLNGSCLIAPGVLLLADCFAGLIWRADLGADARSAEVRVWLTHDTMANDPENDREIPPPPQPGINGVRYGAESGYLYYTSTAQRVFMRVPVDSRTGDATSTPEFVASIDNADDLCLDEPAGVAYVTRHRGNTLDRVPLSPRHGSEVRHLAGDPLDTRLIGPSSAAWGRAPGDHGRTAYVTTDGGTTASPDGVTRPAALIRVGLTAAVEEEVRA